MLRLEHAPGCYCHMCERHRLECYQSGNWRRAYSDIELGLVSDHRIQKDPETSAQSILENAAHSDANGETKAVAGEKAKTR